jgi:hypothetical protein
MWDADKGTMLAELRGHQASVRAAAFSTDGRRVVTASGDSTARVWDASRTLLSADQLLVSASALLERIGRSANASECLLYFPLGTYQRPTECATLDARGKNGTDAPS